MDYNNFDNTAHAQLSQHFKSGANWFYWIAGLTIITSLITFFGGGIRFLFSLGSTQIIDGIAEALSADVGGAAKVVALALDLIVTGVFVLFGYLSNQKHLWVYLVGMVVFLLDGLLSLIFQDWISLIAHCLVLYWLFRGYQAGRELLSLEKAIAESVPQPEPAI